MKRIINVSNRIVILGDNIIKPNQKIIIKDTINPYIEKRIKQLESMRVINVYYEEDKVISKQLKKENKKENKDKSNKKETK